MESFEKGEFLGASKRFERITGNRIKKIDETKWGELDDDWIFPIGEVPIEFRDEKKFQNYVLSKKEEREQKLVLSSRPYHIEIEPTNICNLHCPLCSTGIGAETRKKTKLNLENFKKIVDEIKDYALHLSLQNWGESTLVTELPDMIQYAAEAKIFTRLSSNFSVNFKEGFLKKLICSGLGRLVIDIDGTTQEVYEKYRIGGDLNLVIENTKKALSIKKEKKLEYPIIQARMLVMKHNEHQIEDFKTLARELEVDEFELGNIQMNPNSAAKEWLPNNSEFVYDTYKGERVNTPCHWPWSGLVINSDGGISSCSIVDDAGSDFGNVFENSISEIWNNEKYVSARTTWRKDKKPSEITICNICKNDTHNPNLLRVGDSFSLTLNTSLNKKK